MTSTSVRHLYGTGYSAAKANNLSSYVWQPVVRQLRILPPQSWILDAGCGNGFFAQHLRANGYNVAGVDHEETGTANARKLCPEVRFQTASVYDDLRGLFDRPFDAVVSLEVVEHLYDPRSFVSRVHECLRPGGLFVLSTPYHGYLKNLLIALTGKFDAHADPLWDGGHIKLWSRRTLTGLLEEKGFQVRNCCGAGRMPYLWKSMVVAAYRS